MRFSYNCTLHHNLRVRFQMLMPLDDFAACFSSNSTTYIVLRSVVSQCCVAKCVHWYYFQYLYYRYTFKSISWKLLLKVFSDEPLVPWRFVICLVTLLFGVSFKSIFLMMFSRQSILFAPWIKLNIIIVAVGDRIKLKNPFVYKTRSRSNHYSFALY